MTFAAAVPLSGLAGLSFLKRTRAPQQDVLVAQPKIAREIEAFRTRISQISSPAELVSDRNVLTVALGAFGLDEDINNRYLIEKILSSDTNDPSSLASRFADKRYETMAKAFGFGDIGGPRVTRDGFADTIISRFVDRQFEIAVGETDADLRLALAFEREIAAIMERPGLSENAKWYTAMATPPVRKVMEMALGLPSQFAAIDLDQQLETLQNGFRTKLGVDGFDMLGREETAADVIRTFLVRSQIASIGSVTVTSGTTALRLLRGF